jgi:hypothetical protein
MNILHISSTDLMGGRFTGYYMQQVLGHNHTVELAVWDRTSDNPSIHSLRPGRWLQFSDAVARRCDNKLGLEGLTGLDGWSCPFKEYFKRADVVHLYLIHNAGMNSLAPRVFIGKSLGRWRCGRVCLGTATVCTPQSCLIEVAC